MAAKYRSPLALALAIVIACSAPAAVHSAFAAESRTAAADSIRTLLPAGKYADAERDARKLLPTLQPAASTASIQLARAYAYLGDPLWARWQGATDDDAVPA